MEWPSWWNNVPNEVEFVPISSVSNNYLSTGISILDNILQGGLSFGCIYELVGEGGVGKTNLALELLKNITTQYLGYYLSTQKPVSQSRLQSIGLNTNNLFIRHSSSIENSFYHINEEIPKILENSKKLKIIVIDNIYTLVQDLPSENYLIKASICHGVAIILKYLVEGLKT